ncbi:MAG: hypothetical protein HYT80_06265 [Euryarchaeota archaeon]|nr:hypothetical protein [Euryarchaeota archaeon]
MAELAPVYVNDARVNLQGEPRPKVSRIVRAAGQQPDRVQVRRLRDKTDNEGQPLRLEDFIDRTADTNAVFLRCIEESKGAGILPGAGTPPPTMSPPTPSEPAVTPTPETGDVEPR